MNKKKNPRRAATRKSKRELIIEKAIEVFAAKGSDLTTIADIAKKARIAQGTVYVYFESKDDLLKHCMKEIITAEITSIIEATANIPDTMDRLFEFFAMHVELVKTKPYVARFLTLETRQNEEFYMHNPDFNPLKMYIDFVQKTAKEAIAIGRIRDLNTDALAHLLVGAMDFVLAQWVISGGKLDIEPMVQPIRDILKYGVNEAK